MRSKKKSGFSSEGSEATSLLVRDGSSWLGLVVFQSASLIVCGLLQSASSAVGGSTLSEPVPFFLCFEL